MVYATNEKRDYCQVLDAALAPMMDFDSLDYCINGVTQEEYLKLLMEADTSKRQIRKTRYCLTHQSQYFEIDVYPFWSDQAIAEIKLSDENATVVLPEQLTVVREVTGDPSYSNSAQADM